MFSSTYNQNKTWVSENVERGNGLLSKTLLDSQTILEFQKQYLNI